MKNRRQIRSKIAQLNEVQESIHLKLDANTLSKEKKDLLLRGGIKEDTPREEIVKKSKEIKAMVAALKWVLQ